VATASRTVCFVHHEVCHELRSSAEDKNGEISLHVVLPATRHSRARGNPGLFSTELTWIPAFAGMTEPSASWSLDGAKRSSGASFYKASPHRYFRRRSRRTRRVRMTAQHAAPLLRARSTRERSRTMSFVVKHLPRPFEFPRRSCYPIR